MLQITIFKKAFDAVLLIFILKKEEISFPSAFDNVHMVLNNCLHLESKACFI